MAEGYCTLEDVRRALRKANLPGDLDQDSDIAVDAIASQSVWLERTYKRHWYANADDDIVTESDELDIPQSPKTRDDELDIPTGGAQLIGEAATPKRTQGAYTHIDLDRKDAASVEELLVRTGDDSYEDWVGSNDFDGGTWPDALGDDYYLRVNNDGVSRLYLDADNFLEEDEDDEYVLDSFANAVYLTFTYGHEGIPRNVRRAVALFAGAEFAEELAVQIPENARLYNVETKADEMREQAETLLKPDAKGL